NGYWRPELCPMETVTLDTLAGAVERAVERGEALWAETRKGQAGPPETPGRTGTAGTGGGPVHVEFLLPFDLLNHDMA
ncbi:hypothetical protein G3M58_87995, partial [Streptomyces sp. SID7499]|nr:hypothetical protein [Streptomyces sp. SID7499]